MADQPTDPRAVVLVDREAAARLIETQYRREPDALHQEDDSFDAEGVRKRVRQRDAAAIRSLPPFAQPQPSEAVKRLVELARKARSRLPFILSIDRELYQELGTILAAVEREIGGSK